MLTPETGNTHLPENTKKDSKDINTSESPQLLEQVVFHMRVSGSGAVVIPAEIRHHLQLEEGTFMEVTVFENEVKLKAVPIEEVPVEKREPKAGRPRLYTPEERLERRRASQRTSKSNLRKNNPKEHDLEQQAYQRSKKLKN